MEEMRLQKYVSDCGLMSRRAAEKEIEMGHFKVNGQVAEIGQKINPAEDAVEYKGKLIEGGTKKVYVMLYKPRGYVTTMNDEEGRKGITEIKHINNLYRLWDDMRQEFDGILIDNCAGGGRRIDLESIKRTCILWRSDIGTVPITDTLPVDMWQQNHVLAISEYLPCHSSGTWHTNANAVRSVATSGLNCIYDLLDDNFDTEEASLALDEVIHLGQYWDGDFYPLTKPVYNEEGFAGWQLNKDGNGFAVIFRRQNCTEDEFTVMFNGVDENAEYILTISDEDRKNTTSNATGKELSGGYKVCLPKVRTSVVIEYRKNK